MFETSTPMHALVKGTNTYYIYVFARKAMRKHRCNKY